MGALMSTGNYRFSTDDFAVAPSRDSVLGFAEIASALDRGLLAGPNPRRQQFLDVCAIACGWAALVAVVLHPELLLAAIGLTVGALALRPLWRVVLGPSERTYSRRSSTHRAVLQYS